MKIVRAILFIFFITVSSSAWAQFSVSNIKPSEFATISPFDSLKTTNYNNEFFSRARWEAERRKKRLERNLFEFTATMQLTQTQFENWAVGGDNTFSGRSTIYLRHQFKVEKFMIDNKVEARYGFNSIGGLSHKNEDEFKYNLMMTWKIKNSWSYAGTLGFRSQFTDGFKSRTDDSTLVSAFLSPAYLDLAIGFNFHKDKSPLSITISPISGQITYVLNDTLSKQGKFGVEKGSHVKTNAGPSLRVDFDKTFGKKKVVRLRSYLYAFSNFGPTAQARWENTIEIKATKFITTTLYGMLYYEEPTKTPLPKKLQFKSSLGLGLAYTFKNKSK